MVPADTALRHLLTQLAEFQRALNEQFDACRRAPPERRRLALRRASAGVALLCHLQQHLLQPVLPEPSAGLAALHDLTALGARASDDAQQRAVAALLEGLVQLEFAQLEERLAAADVPAARWAELDRAMAGLLSDWWSDASLGSVVSSSLAARA